MHKTYVFPASLASLPVSWAFCWVIRAVSLTFWPPAVSCTHRFACSVCPGARILLRKLAIQEKEESAVIPKAPEVKKPAMAKPVTRAAGTKTGLQMIKSGVARARQVRVPANVRPERRRRVPPTGRRVTTARSCDLDGVLSGNMPLMASLGCCCCW
ncbi:hypothetical protein CICLE_v10022650mg [Citrus x clementina]|uniref:Uncharacterized protein n=1 Tax=Citrus clementina TaxID=85681 RepID=V4TIG8_CITCL|nr:hypothetical protein CICLE_v10022650mg [Citrus x clementina]